MLKTGVSCGDMKVTWARVGHRIPDLSYSPPQKVGKYIHDNKRGGHKMGTIKCYWKTEEWL